ncbi:protein Lines homolog 1 isoform X1 [Xyrauchen texanus]|uniref:protein Lines homolog 1 isoform X1 n=2 Tax=Xyrauchen texanus TaxID=154827 RepID=UPI002241A9E1|nr:protein Lines homolog 1 isoform X1 [Xyrauchen texanus]
MTSNCWTTDRIGRAVEHDCSVNGSEFLIMDSSGLDFQTIFRLLHAGAAPNLCSKDLASRISSCLSPQTVIVTDTAIICLCLTLTEKIITRLSCQSLPQDVRIFCEDVMRSLFGKMNLMAKLISLFSCQDQLVSHLSAKCMSAYVINDICLNGSSCSLWIQTCSEVFQKSNPSSELDFCLWSLTAVIKGVLRADCQNKNDVLTKLLAALDADLICLYANILPKETMEPHKIKVKNLCKTKCVFFDLLEVLSAARLRCGVCSFVQRTIFIQSRALLHVMRADVDYLVKKRALLLLKRTLLRRAGEDWTLGDVHFAAHEDGRLTDDMLSMAKAVLQEVEAGWLKEVPVKTRASFFGGNCNVGLSGTQKDDVMLRALSLILLKSLEINIQFSCVKETQSNIDIQQYLTELISFLIRHGTTLSQDTHSCSWVYLVFAEQDDDMMESAKALIALYLYQKSLSSSDSGVCAWGCNPHCHFILLLRFISFDSSVLLDFLISTDTCFLEYCVRYLKLLCDDWMGFCRSCHHIEDCDDTTVTFKVLSDIAETSESSQMSVSCTRTSTVIDVRDSQVSHLVDYESSDESEEAEVSIFNSNTKVDSGRAVAEATFCPSVTALEQVQTEHVSEYLFGNVVVCLVDLRTAIARLHNRGLFPYNPTSLLKLLNNIEPKRNMVS